MTDFDDLDLIKSDPYVRNLYACWCGPFPAISSGEAIRWANEYLDETPGASASVQAFLALVRS